ncbi:hypothetical protein JCM10908_001973 [Rhodotorula pacifica]|uniref:uncharacterized protein n=1 Tax=Rhodotorula pacifica TaxID=1495444 RepID=UPI00317E2408
MHSLGTVRRPSSFSEKWVRGSRAPRRRRKTTYLLDPLANFGLSLGDQSCPLCRFRRLHRAPLSYSSDLADSTCARGIEAECTLSLWHDRSQTRCSSCYSESGLSLYFAQTKQQKLICPHHRLACAKRAHPFHPPAFTSEEASLLVYRLGERDVGEGGDERQTVLRKFAARDIEATRGFMPAVIDGELVAYGPSFQVLIAESVVLTPNSTLQNYANRTAMAS